MAHRQQKNYSSKIMSIHKFCRHFSYYCSIYLISLYLYIIKHIFICNFSFNFAWISHSNNSCRYILCHNYCYIAYFLCYILSINLNTIKSIYPKCLHLILFFLSLLQLQSIKFRQPKAPILPH